MLIPVVVPLCVLGAVGYLARNRQAPRPVGRVSSSSDEPSPLTVMGSFLCLGEVPPPGVVYGAVGQAESLGCQDLADELVRLFVLPGFAGAGGAPAAGTHARNAPPPSYVVAPAGPRMTAPVGSPATVGPPPTASVAAARVSHSTADARANGSSSAEPPGSYSTVMGGEGDVDAQRVLEELASAEPATKVEFLSGAAAVLVPEAEARHVLQELAAASGRAAKVEILASASPERESEAIDSSWLTPSPIEGVAMPAWRAFVGRVSREPATFAARHHVGQFRQRRERLIEMGIDPAAIIGSPEAQLVALDVEMRDAYRHARASGVIDEYLGTTVAISVGDDVRPTEVTLSGVLGVMQAAGLEGAVRWLEQPEDRTRFPHTTQAFLRCNGVF